MTVLTMRDLAFLGSIAKFKYATISGGTENTFSVGADNFRTHTFTGDGTLTVISSGYVRALVVAGGGAGGNGFSGGGGGGGGVLDQFVFLSVGSYSVSVGAGGLNSAAQGDPGFPGGDSSIGSIIVTIGGGGGSSYDDTKSSRKNGGSGGGGTGHATLNGRNLGGTGVAGPPRQGYKGGDSFPLPGYGNGAGSGGGGGGGAGQDAILNGNILLYGGKGGDGRPSDITGSVVYYGAGGGGASSGSVPGGAAGLGGSGTGGNSTVAAGASGAANTGAGCGGHHSGAPVRTGGSGIVIVRVQTN